jgi:cell division protein FtsB
MELLLKQHYKEMQCMKQKLKDLKDENAKLQNQNEALILDVAFYGGNMINLSCNNK